MSTEKKSTSCTPNLWGGVECSFNRVGDRVIDQLAYSGHYERGTTDIAAFASLGIKAIRYPIIWERHQPEPGQPIDWQWTEHQLSALRQANIDPIAGLLHHGNGPAFTNLLDPEFPQLFANYARNVAEKFPWIKYYTPINEPLTTARFSGLYGIWYPHSRNDRDFVFILLNQMKAIVLAMQEIRKVNSEAMLVQTEDLAKTYSTPLLQYQATFENQRRWLTYDLLCGMFTPDHPLWSFFESQKIPTEMLDFFLEHRCPPDIIGADYYLTSERFLDENVDRYPDYKRGGNHQHAYADVEAIRVDHPFPWGLKMLIRECWERYQIPIAISEVHIRGNSHEQILWFDEVWNVARSLLQEGVEIKGVTVWSLLGAFGWSSLLTIPDADYESGPFDVSAGTVRPTEFASYIKSLGENPSYRYPGLRKKGWWQKKSRCFYNVNPDCARFDPLRAIA